VPLESGQVVAGYRIDGVLGEGGMGVVYEATQLSLERKVALKLISGALGDDFSFRERFRREGLIQAAIDHPNIVTVYEAGESEHGLFLAMRLIRGPSLRDLILGRELEPERALRFLDQVADALDTAHEAGLIHRDIKPSNVLVSTGARDHAYLADFGVTKVPGEASLTRTGQLVGTIDYMAPEVIRGEPATSASDIYALGALLYECLTGSIPYPRETDAAVLYAHLFDAPPRVTQERPDLPSAIDGVVERGMASEPAERYASAGELARDAARALGAGVAELGVPAAVRAPEQIGVRRPEDAVSTPAAMTRPAVPETRQAPPPAPSTIAAPAPPPERRMPAAVPWVAASALVAVLAIGGFVAGRAAGGETEAGLETVRASGLALSVPAAWEVTDRDVDRKRLDLRDAVRVDSPGDASRRLLVGRFAPPPSGGLAEPTPQLVSLGNVQAYGYRNVPMGSERVDLYDVVDAGGEVVRIACVRPDDPAASRSCSQIAASARPMGITPIRLTPSAEYASSIGAALEKLGDKRAAALERLRSAETPLGQAAAAADLRETHAAAGRSIGRAAAPQVAMSADRAIVSALDSAVDAYDRLAKAARAGNQASYDRARTAAVAAEKQLDRAMEQLDSLGYTVR
jgi:Protein kinase domain